MKIPAILEFDLEPNSQVDAIIAANALIHWVEAIREASKIVDPTGSIEIDLVSAEPACLRFTAALDFIDNKMTDASRALDRWPQIKKAIALNIIILPGAVAGGVTVNLLSENDEQPEEVRQVQKSVSQSPKVRQHIESFYSTIQCEPAIRKVIIRETKESTATIIVERGEFAERSGLWLHEVEEYAEEREGGDVWDIIVTHPVSIGKKLKWGFMRDGLPFKAKMMDEKILASIRAGDSSIAVQEGVKLRARVSWTETQEGGNWVPDEKTYKIEQVLTSES